MIKAYKKYWTRYFDFNGCSSRSDFWWTVLCNIIISIIVVILLSLFLSSGMSEGFLGIIELVWGLANIIPVFSLKTRRYHDANVSGWWLFSFIVYSIALKICICIGILFEGIIGIHSTLAIETSVVIAIIAYLIHIGFSLVSIGIEILPSSTKSRWRTSKK